MKKTTQIGIRISIEEKEQLEKIASQENRSVSNLINSLIKKLLASKNG